MELGMSKFSKPAVIFCDGRLFQLKPEQYQRLYPLIKGLHGEELHRVGRAFLVTEGVIKDGNPTSPGF
jgi:hypothetical protein